MALDKHKITIEIYTYRDETPSIDKLITKLQNGEF